MFKLEAPYPNIEATSFLPNPEFSDTENAVVKVNSKRAVDGTQRTYIKKPGRRKLQWQFEMRRLKAYELREFLLRYNAKPIRVTDHNGRVWVGNFVTNPVEFESTNADWQSATLEFEGVEQ